MQNFDINQAIAISHKNSSIVVLASDTAFSNSLLSKLMKSPRRQTHIS